jgi:aldehyde:ferredoxin oxidoreductase
MPDYRPGIDPLTEEDKPAIAKWCEECIGIEHCLETCIFCYGGFGCSCDFRIPRLLARIYTAVTGLDSTGEQLMEVGERLTNLERCFNIREGLQKKDDTLPDRFTKQAMPEGPSKGHVIGIGPMVDKYYELRGWNVETGLPRRAKLEALGLKEVADELEGLGRLSK